MEFDTPRQPPGRVHCAWGLRGLRRLAESADVLVIVDVLSFSTTVTVAVARGAWVYPCRWQGGRADDLAVEVGAVVAAPRGTPGALSLSPVSMSGVTADTRVILPSPNGSNLSFEARGLPVFAGCVRNASAVAAAAAAAGRHIGVVAAGERWPDDGALRPALEDWLGAGAIIVALHEMGREGTGAAMAAAAAFDEAQPMLVDRISACASGQELIEQGFEDDVHLAADLDVETVSPSLDDGPHPAYRVR